MRVRECMRGRKVAGVGRVQSLRCAHRGRLCREDGHVRRYASLPADLRRSQPPVTSVVPPSVCTPRGCAGAAGIVENVVLMGAPVDTNVQAWEDARAVVAGRSTALHCTALHCTALHCTALHCTALHACVTPSLFWALGPLRTARTDRCQRACLACRRQPARGPDARVLSQGVIWTRTIGQ